MDAEPALSCVAAVLGAVAGALPVMVGHQVDELDGRGAGGAEGVEGGPDVGALVVAQAGGVAVLIVGLDLRVSLG